MAITTLTNGYNDGSIFNATSNVTWTGLGSSPYATWANWTRWNPEPNTMTIKIFEDAGSKDYRLPLLGYNYDGTLTFVLKIADSVDSSNTLLSPTTYTINESTTVSPIAGRYYEFTLTVTTDSNGTIPWVIGFNLEFDDAKTQEIQKDINTATLSGTIDARIIDTQINVVTTVIATAKEQGVTYSSGTLRDRVYSVPDDYVFQENAIIVNVVNKSTPSIRCFDLNGESIDAVIDILIEGLPSMILTPGGLKRT